MSRCTGKYYKRFAAQLAANDGVMLLDDAIDEERRMYNEYAELIQEEESMNWRRTIKMVKELRRLKLKMERNATELFSMGFGDGSVYGVTMDHDGEEITRSDFKRAEDAVRQYESYIQRFKRSTTNSAKTDKLFEAHDGTIAMWKRVSANRTPKDWKYMSMQPNCENVLDASTKPYKTVMINCSDRFMEHGGTLELVGATSSQPVWILAKKTDSMLDFISSAINVAAFGRRWIESAKVTIRAVWSMHQTMMQQVRSQRLECHQHEQEAKSLIETVWKNVENNLKEEADKEKARIQMKQKAAEAERLKREKEAKREEERLAHERMKSLEMVRKRNRAAAEEREKVMKERAHLARVAIANEKAEERKQKMEREREERRQQRARVTAEVEAKIAAESAPVPAKKIPDIVFKTNKKVQFVVNKVVTAAETGGPSSSSTTIEPPVYRRDVDHRDGDPICDSVEYHDEMPHEFGSNADACLEYLKRMAAAAPQTQQPDDSDSDPVDTRSEWESIPASIRNGYRSGWVADDTPAVPTAEWERTPYAYPRAPSESSESPTDAAFTLPGNPHSLVRSVFLARVTRTFLGMKDDDELARRRQIHDLLEFAGDRFPHIQRNCISIKLHRLASTKYNDAHAFYSCLSNQYHWLVSKEYRTKESMFYQDNMQPVDYSDEELEQELKAVEYEEEVDGRMHEAELELERRSHDGHDGVNHQSCRRRLHARYRFENLKKERDTMNEQLDIMRDEMKELNDENSRLRREKEAMMRDKEDDEQCVLCFGPRRCMASIACGHLLYCEDCHRDNALPPNCPMCDRRTSRYLRIYV